MPLLYATTMRARRIRDRSSRRPPTRGGPPRSRATPNTRRASARRVSSAGADPAALRSASARAVHDRSVTTSWRLAAGTRSAEAQSSDRTGAGPAPAARADARRCSRLLQRALLALPESAYVLILRRVRAPAVYDGGRLAFGGADERAARPSTGAQVILALDADFPGEPGSLPSPAPLRGAARPGGGAMARPLRGRAELSVTGMIADERLRRGPASVAALRGSRCGRARWRGWSALARCAARAQRCGLSTPSARRSPKRWRAICGRRGAAARWLSAGRQPPVVHAAGARDQPALGNAGAASATRSRAHTTARRRGGALASSAEEMRGGPVDTLRARRQPGLRRARGSRVGSAVARVRTRLHSGSTRTRPRSARRWCVPRAARRWSPGATARADGTVTSSSR